MDSLKTQTNRFTHSSQQQHVLSGLVVQMRRTAHTTAAGSALRKCTGFAPQRFPACLIQNAKPSSVFLPSTKHLKNRKVLPNSAGLTRATLLLTKTTLAAAILVRHGTPNFPSPRLAKRRNNFQSRARQSVLLRHL